MTAADRARQARERADWLADSRSADLLRALADDVDRLTAENESLHRDRRLVMVGVMEGAAQILRERAQEMREEASDV